MKKKNSIFTGLLIVLLTVIYACAANAEPKPDRRSSVAPDMYESVPSAGAEEGAQEGAAVETEEQKRLKNAWRKVNGVIYNGSGYPVPGALKWGIDVSVWQRQIN